MNLTSSAIRYLMAIHSLSSGGAPVRSVDVAHALSVTRASVSKTLKLLAADGLIDKAHYGDILLTAKGTQAAERLYSQTTSLHHVLHYHLGLDSDTAIKDALTCVAVLSDQALERLTMLSLSAEEQAAFLRCQADTEHTEESRT